jgi:hypothetical protein
MLGLKRLEIRKTVKPLKEPIKTKTERFKIEPNPSKDRAMHEGDNLSFLDEFIQFIFFVDSSIHIRIFILSRTINLETNCFLTLILDLYNQLLRNC